jgi:hypothetical protein
MISKFAARRDPAPRDAPDMRGLLIARFGAVLWPSFFAAGVASMVFFAIVDPSELAAMTWPHATISREAGYTIGFFMFWACTFASSLFTALLSPVSSDFGSTARDAS